MTSFTSRGFSSGLRLVINKGCLLRCNVFPGWVCGRIFEFFAIYGHIFWFRLTEEPIGCPGIILESQIFIFGMGSRDPTVKVPE